MKYILDTDTIIYFLKGIPSVVDKCVSVSFDKLSTSIISHAELMFGAHNSIKKKQNLEKINEFLSYIPIIEFCKKSSNLFGELKASLKTKGNSLADLDLMIASIALKQDAILVTNNIKHFSRIKNIKLENWINK